MDSQRVHQLAVRQQSQSSNGGIFRKRGDDMEESDITAPLQSETLEDSELNSLFPKKIQGGFFNWSALKMTKCQTLRKF